MAGNSSRRGATSKGKNKAAGSGGRIRRSLEGRGPTPKAEDRTYHKAYKAKQAAQRKQQTAPKRASRSAVGADWVVGRNPVYEALMAGLPSQADHARQHRQEQQRYTIATAPGQADQNADKGKQRGRMTGGQGMAGHTRTDDGDQFRRQHRGRTRQGRP